jgi:predicted aspartyl protease
MRPRAALLAHWTPGLVAGLLAAAAAAAAEAPAGDVPPEAVVAAMPFANDVPFRVVVDLAPDGGRPFPWILDTGAASSVMTPREARAHGVSVRQTKSSPYVRDTRLGRSVRFWVDTRWTDTSSATGWEYALLGGDFLAEYVVEIDLSRRTVRFLDPERYRVPEQTSAPDERVLPMRVVGNRPSIEVAVGDRRTWVLLDTGAPENLILSGTAAAKLGIDWKQLPDFGRFGTTVGPMDVRLHETSAFELAGWSFPTMPVFVAPKGWYNIGGGNDSVVGLEALRPFVMRLDYRRGRLWLKRSGELAVTCLGVPYALTRDAGVFLEPSGDGRYRVAALMPGGPAARMGLLPGDVAVAAAGELFDLATFLGHLARGEEVTVARWTGDAWVDFILPDPTGADD